MFHWLRDRRRRTLLETPFPDDYRAIIARNLGLWKHLDEAQQTHLCQLTQVFLAEKAFEGCGGLTLTDEVRVTIAAGACVLLLGLDHDMYRRVQSILVYPSTVVPPERQDPVFGQRAKPRDPIHPLLGEAHRGGPVILAWDAARHGCRDAKNGHNVVFHEFAHKLDMLDGEVDGTPPLRSSAELKRWAEVCSTAYLDLKARTASGKRTLLDGYGAVSEAEFFAVATETFFERPTQLQKERPELYDVLKAFYRQDPATLPGM